MSLIPTIFRSTDPGAPILTGTAGSFAALMDAVLVDGYGVGVEAKAPLGWSREFTAGQKRAYRNSVIEGGTGFYWRIDDSNAQYVLCGGFHSMTSIDVGVDGFGSTANAWSKSTTASTTPRDWVVVGNSRSVYVFISNGFTGGSHAGFLIGDYPCINRSYTFNFGLTRTGVTTTSNAVSRTSLLTTSTTYGDFTSARTFDGAVVGAAMTARASVVAGQTTFGGSGGAPYPYPATGGMMVSRVLLNSGGYLFGMYPGLWAPEHVGVLTKFTEYSGLSGLPTGRWLAIEANVVQAGQGLLQLDGEWEY